MLCWKERCVVLRRPENCGERVCVTNDSILDARLRAWGYGLNSTIDLLSIIFMGLMIFIIFRI